MSGRRPRRCMAPRGRVHIPWGPLCQAAGRSFGCRHSCARAQARLPHAAAQQPSAHGAVTRPLVDVRHACAGPLSSLRLPPSARFYSCACLHGPASRWVPYACTWPVAGPLLRANGPSLGPFCVDMACPWAPFACTWPVAGPLLRAHGPSLGPFCVHMARRWVLCVHMASRQAHADGPVCAC